MRIKKLIFSHIIKIYSRNINYYINKKNIQIL